MAQPGQEAAAVIFDGDDTLWATQELYEAAKARFFELLNQQLGYSHEQVAAKFGQIDVANVPRLGFSKERFPKSMGETYEFFCHAAGRRPQPSVIDEVTAIGASVFDRVPAVRADARSVLSKLRQHCRLILFTAGDEAVQQRRIDQSGLGGFFQSIRITPLKTLESWTDLVSREALRPATSWSIGNSVRSDINPAVELGMGAVLVAADTWDYERVASTAHPRRVETVATLSEAADIVLAAVANVGR